MDSTRISIARVLALDVPLSWQDAVAIMREVAVLAEMNAAWNEQPSLVRADRCFLTADGDVDLPDRTERDTPADLVVLLADLLRGRDAPADVENLTRRYARADLSGALTAIAVGDRRRLIAAVFARARAIATGTAPPAPPAGPGAATTAVAAAVPAMLETPALEASPPDASLLPAPRSVVVPLRSARAAAGAAAFVPEPEPIPLTAGAPEPAPEPSPRPVEADFTFATAAPERMPSTPARIIRPPFVAAPMPPARSTAMVDVLPVAPDEPTSRELERLRQKSAAATPSPPPTLRRLLPWIYWRPDTFDPRLVGGAALVISATVAVMIGSAPRAARPAPAPTDAAPAAFAPAPSGTAETLPAGSGSALIATGVSAATGATGSLSASGPTHAAPPSAAVTPTPALARPAGPALAPPSRSGAGGRDTAGMAGPGPGSTPSATAAPTTPASSPASTWVEGAGRTTAVERRPARERDTRERDGRVADPSVSLWLPPSRTPLYSAIDSGVTPPVMLRQQLPSALLEPPAAARADWPFLELVVDERGAVEAVRLRAVTVAPRQTLYRHRMLLAAAKAWQFAPATRDGVPVRFLMRIPLEP